jgi:myo-inositol-1-phosphate synthase
VVGGHDIRQASILESAMQMVNESHAIPKSLVDEIAEDLTTWNRNFRPGILNHSGPAIEALATPGHYVTTNTPREAVDHLKADLRQFADAHGLERVVVVHLASTEPPADPQLAAFNWEQLNSQLDYSEMILPPSTVYAIAAMESGMPFVNFTPSVGSNLNALRELAIQQQVCHAGRDGKTGETFLKSVLAPAFAARNLEVMSWVGHNIFGNRDGVVLDDPANKLTKVKSKDSLLGQMLGYQPQTHTSIEYIQSLGDWKTAWDHIHFRGFLGTPMVMQFTWQGCDSILAAPLVLDLVRFTMLAVDRGVIGELPFLSCFFKSPQGTAENAFPRQFQMLVDWTQEMSEAANTVSDAAIR